MLMPLHTGLIRDYESGFLLIVSRLLLCHHCVHDKFVRTYYSVVSASAVLSAWHVGTCSFSV
jgi:hypothetical protein